MTNIVRQYVLSSFDERWMNFSMRLNIAKENPSMENVHHFRVAARRLLVLLDLINNFLPQSKYEKMRKYLRGLRSNFDALHDTQMVIDSLIIARDKGLEIEPILKLVQKSENRLHKDAIKVISSLKTDHLFESSIQIRTELVNVLADPNFLDEQILPKLDDGYIELKRISKSINPSEVSTIHDLRISYRKFRYMIEILLPILHDYPPEHLALMRTYQDLMGEIQNGEIILNHLNKLPKKLPRKKCEPVFAFFQANYEAAIATFLEHFDQTPQFWRDSSSSIVPWILKPEGLMESEIQPQAMRGLLSETEATSINPNDSLSESETDSAFIKPDDIQTESEPDALDQSI